MKNKIFQKFRIKNRKYCKIFGITIRYGKVPLARILSKKVDALQQNSIAQFDDIKNLIAGQFNIIKNQIVDTSGQTNKQIANHSERVANLIINQFGDINNQIADLHSKITAKIIEQVGRVDNQLTEQSDSIKNNLNEFILQNADKLSALVGYAKNISQTSGSGLNKEQFDQLVNIANNAVNSLNYIQKTFPIYLAAASEHQKVFPKYRNCNKGKDMVLLASGPTLDDYTAQKNVLFMGVNKSFMANKADLDYLFVQDLFLDVQDKIDEYKGNNCKKFYGVHNLVPGIAQSHADKANAERYYFIDMNMLSPWPFPVDCSTMPFNTYSSVVHPAAVFALWTGVKKLYLVGCDCTSVGHFGDNTHNSLCVDNVIYGWQRFKEFAAIWYPETEIISVNPVGLRGIFHDVYTKSYLEKCPDSLDTKPEILKQ